MGNRKLGAGGFAVVAVVLSSLSGSEPVPAPVRRIHGDGAALERAVTDTVRSFLRDDAAGALEAMDRLEASCRRLSRDDSPAVPGDVVLYDQALHTALARSRDYGKRGHVTQGFDQFVWVMRACRQCHEVARRNGLFPAPAPHGEAEAEAPRP